MSNFRRSSNNLSKERAPSWLEWKQLWKTRYLPKPLLNLLHGKEAPVKSFRTVLNTMTFSNNLRTAWRLSWTVIKAPHRTITLSRTMNLDPVGYMRIKMVNRTHRVIIFLIQLKTIQNWIFIQVLPNSKTATMIRKGSLILKDPHSQKSTKTLRRKNPRVFRLLP